MLASFILSAFDWARQVQITPLRLEYVKRKEAELFNKLLVVGNKKQQEIRQLISQTLIDMKDELISAAASHVFERTIIITFFSKSFSNYIFLIDYHCNRRQHGSCGQSPGAPMHWRNSKSSPFIAQQGYRRKTDHHHTQFKRNVPRNATKVMPSLPTTLQQRSCTTTWSWTVLFVGLLALESSETVLEKMRLAEAYLCKFTSAKGLTGSHWTAGAFFRSRRLTSTILKNRAMLMPTKAILIPSEPVKLWLRFSLLFFHHFLICLRFL